MDKQLVVISRAWARDAPITISVIDTEIAVSMPLNAFIDAVVEEAGNPAMLMTMAGMRARLEKAASTVCEKMKRETGKVM